jgi:hypothetical protein
VHVVFDAVEYLGFIVVNISEKPGVMEVELGGAGRFLLVLFGGGYQLLGTLQIEEALGRHAAQDAAAADGDVAVFVGKQDRGADALVAAAGRVGSVDGGQDGNAHLLQFGVTKKSGSAAAPVGIEFFLLGELDPAAVDQPDQRDVQTLGQVGDPQDVLILTGQPGAGEDLVVETDDDGPLAGDLAQTVDHVVGPLGVVLGVEKSVQRAPGSRINEVAQPLPNGHLPPGVYFFFR